MCRNLMWANKYYIPSENKFKISFLGSVKNYPNLTEFDGKWEPGKYGFLTSCLKLPCGQCIDCRLQRARNWADRCMLELKNYKYNQFITLTYAPEHLPTKPGVNIETGELMDRVGTLQPKDLQDFMKKLRITWQRKFGHDNIRFFACGEYGEIRERPHYHLIIFNLPVPDKTFSHYSKRHMPIFTSKLIEDIWNKGRVTVQDVTWETCAYTARYIMKKQTGKGADAYYEKIGRVPEFVRMSRRPGIARDYYEEHKDDIYATDEIYIPTRKGINKVKPARYYDKLYDIEYPDVMRDIKKQRLETAKLKLESKLRSTDMAYTEMMENLEYCKDEQIKALKRDYENGVG